MRTVSTVKGVNVFTAIDLSAFSDLRFRNRQLRRVQRYGFPADAEFICVKNDACETPNSPGYVSTNGLSDAEIHKVVRFYDIFPQKLKEYINSRADPEIAVELLKLLGQQGTLPSYVRGPLKSDNAQVGLAYSSLGQWTIVMVELDLGKNWKIVDVWGGI